MKVLAAAGQESPKQRGLGRKGSEKPPPPRGRRAGPRGTPGGGTRRPVRPEPCASPRGAESAAHPRAASPTNRAGRGEAQLRAAPGAAAATPRPDGTLAPRLRGGPADNQRGAAAAVPRGRPGRQRALQTQARAAPAPPPRRRPVTFQQRSAPTAPRHPLPHTRGSQTFLPPPRPPHPRFQPG